ncbi:hypothetical protein [Psychrobacter sp. 16-MNA-CIBAN-0192]
MRAPKQSLPTLAIAWAFLWALHGAGVTATGSIPFPWCLGDSASALVRVQ